MRIVAAMLVMLALCGTGQGDATAAEPRTYRVEHNASPAGTTIRSYYFDLVSQILTETEGEFGPARLQKVPEDVPQARLLALLAHHDLDVLWTTTNKQREGMVEPIRIPLDMGLTGRRALVIRADRKAEFDAITNVQQLARLKACQGAFWPDTAVLRAAGLRVVEMEWIDLAYPALKDGRCDYLPRGLSEIDGEVAAMKEPGVMVYDRLLLSYTLPMYLFVAPAEPALRQRLAVGLERMVASGELHRFMQQHPTTRGVFPLSRYDGARILVLTNPDLPAETPTDDPRLWIDITATESQRPKS